VSDSARNARLQADLESLEALKRDSTIFDFEATGHPPDRYTLIFRGKGVKRDPMGQSEVEYLDVHRCDVRLPYSYPGRPPDIRWITSIFHPNISFSGFINLRDVGLPWQASVTLADVCQRLWDVTRLGYLNLDRAVNYSARNWYKNQTQLQLPLDARPLRDRVRPVNTNVVRYERRGTERIARTRVLEQGEVLYIGEDTPLPSGKETREWSEGDDILYIE
jgi:ubiquitin-protein ligase